MTPEMVIDLYKDAIMVIITVVAILIIPSLITGFVISVFQAATQINEQSLSFIPRLIVTFITIIVAAPFVSNLIINFTHKIIEDIPFMLG